MVLVFFFYGNSPLIFSSWCISFYDSQWEVDWYFLVYIWIFYYWTSFWSFLVTIVFLVIVVGGSALFFYWIGDTTIHLYLCSLSLLHMYLTEEYVACATQVSNANNCWIISWLDAIPIILSGASHQEYLCEDGSTIRFWWRSLKYHPVNIDFGNVRYCAGEHVVCSGNEGHWGLVGCWGLRGCWWEDRPFFMCFRGGRIRNRGGRGITVRRWPLLATPTTVYPCCCALLSLLTFHSRWTCFFLLCLLNYLLEGRFGFLVG